MQTFKSGLEPSDKTYFDLLGVEYKREVFVERRTSEILNDHELLSQAIGDQLYGESDCDPVGYEMLLRDIALATTESKQLASALLLKGLLKNIACCQAEEEIPKNV